MKQLSLARVQNLKNAKEIHAFNQSMKETMDWIHRKDREMITADLQSNLEALANFRSRHDAFLVS